jgi:hypothetical protein
MERTQRKRTPQQRGEAPAEEAEVTTDREATLADIDGILDEVDEVLERAERINDRAAAALPPIPPDPEADIHAVGLYGPSDLDEDIARELEAATRQSTLEDQGQARAEDFACMICGQCPVRAGCPYVDDNGDSQWAPYPDGEDPYPF